MPVPSFITIILVASLSTSLFAQDCNNPLLAVYNFTALNASESGANLPYCNDLQGAQTCCSADTVSGFQERMTGLVNDLNASFADKDLYLARLRNRFYDRFRDMLSDISDDDSDDIRRIRRVNATLADQLQSDVSSFRQISNEARGIDNQFIRALRDYQTARTSCFTTALQVQASSWCLACDPNYATQGVADDGTVTFSDSLCQTINDACWPLFNQSARFNPLIRAREAYWQLSAVSRYLDDFSDTNRVTNFTVAEDPYSPLPSQQAVSVPDVWVVSNETTALGRCQNLWAGDESLRDLLVTDEALAAESGLRLLQNVLAGGEGVWNPDLTGSGLDFDLVSNPAFIVDRSDSSDYARQSQIRNNQNSSNNGTQVRPPGRRSDNSDSDSDNNTDSDDRDRRPRN